MARDGLCRRDDTLPRRYFEEPVREGTAQGAVIMHEDFEGMLDEYYRLHGWDENGIPKRRTLIRLGLNTE